MRCINENNYSIDFNYERFCGRDGAEKYQRLCGECGLFPVPVHGAAPDGALCGPAVYAFDGGKSDHGMYESYAGDDGRLCGKRCYGCLRPFCRYDYGICNRDHLVCCQGDARADTGA